MALRVHDVITEDFVRESVEELVESDLVYRQLFSQIDATGIQSNAYTFTIAEDDMGRVRVVPEGAEVPRHESSLKQETVTFDKFAGEIAFTMESQEDGMFDMKAREVEDLGRAMDKTLNAEAFTELDNSIQNEVTHSGTLDFATLRDAVIALRKKEYNPDTLVLGIDAYGDLMTDNNFNNAAQGGNHTVPHDGNVGSILGMNLVLDNVHLPSTDVGNAHGGYLLDTDRFGYELRRTPMATNTYDDPERMADVVQVYTRRSWKALFADAGLRISG